MFGLTNTYDTFYNLLQKWLFLISTTNKEQILAFNILENISQWLNQTPGFNIDNFSKYLVEVEETFLKEFDQFDNEQKQLVFIYIRCIIRIIDDLSIPFFINKENIETIDFTIFTKDIKYKYLVLEVIDFLENDFYREEEIFSFLSNLRKEKFKKYSWKNNMLEKGK